MTKVHIVSGFLGAGKTTFLRKVIRELTDEANGSRKERIVVIENDFGEVNVDAELLSDSGVQVRELSAGCICCSLVGDLEKSIREIVEVFSPDSIWIEPSGVGRLSDVERAVLSPSLEGVVQLGKKITLINGDRLDVYLSQFGTFFEDQIRYADVLLVRGSSGTLADVTARLSVLCPEGAVFTDDGGNVPWANLSVRSLLEEYVCCRADRSETGCVCANHSHDGCCGHSHDPACAESSDGLGADFESMTIYPKAAMTREALLEKLEALESRFGGRVLRMKGFVRAEEVCDGTVSDEAEGSCFWQVQYLPGSSDISRILRKRGAAALSVIGRNLEREAVAVFFDEDDG